MANHPDVPEAEPDAADAAQIRRRRRRFVMWLSATVVFGLLTIVSALTLANQHNALPSPTPTETTTPIDTSPSASGPPTATQTPGSPVATVTVTVNPSPVVPVPSGENAPAATGPPAQTGQLWVAVTALGTFVAGAGSLVTGLAAFSTIRRATSGGTPTQQRRSRRSRYPPAR
jgi:hypothetical protein